MKTSPFPFFVAIGLLAIFLAAKPVETRTQPSRPLSLASQAKPADEGQLRAIAAGRALIGQAAPRLTLKTIDGEAVDLGAFYGKRPVYLKFWATYCVPCRLQMPSFKADFARYGRDIEIIAVNTGFNESRAAVDSYRKTWQLPMPIAIDDGSLAAAFGLRVTPQHIVIGRDGRVLYVGHLEDEKLADALKVAIAQPQTSTLSAQSGNEESTKPNGIQVDVRPFHGVNGEGVSFRAGHSSIPFYVLFLSPWCESYLAKSRPGMALQCRHARETFDAAIKHNAITGFAIASGLWANADEARSFAKNTQFAAPVVLDADGKLFRKYHVQHVPTLLRLDLAGKVVTEIRPDKDNFEKALAVITPRKEHL